MALPRPARRPRPVPHRGRHRPGRVQRGQGQQRLHEPDGAAQPRRRRRPGGKARGRGPRARRHHRGGGLLARRRRGHVPALRRAPPGAPAARRLHQLRPLGLQGDPGGPLPAAAALPVLPAVPQAGGEAGRRGARHAAAPRRLHRRAEAPQLRLLRGHHRQGLKPVPVHPGGDGRRGRPPGPRLRLPRRGRLHGPGGPRAQHQGRPAHRLPGRRVDRPGQRLRRDARRRRPAVLRPQAPARHHRPVVPHALPGPDHPGLHPRPRGHLLAAGRRAPGDQPLRRPADGQREGSHPRHPGLRRSSRPRPSPPAASRSRTAPATTSRLQNGRALLPRPSTERATGPRSSGQESS